jgi:protein-S-isoprenylcysteine O-methyltransferase Ste14
LAEVKPSVSAKIAYALLFVALLPLGFVAWAKSTAHVVEAPIPSSMPLGVALCGVGAALLVSGWIALWIYGGGLPMNISPPPRYVMRGIYGLLPHPIYTGFALLCAGVAILNHSASGLWLVTSFVILGSAALVWGYEAPDLAARFGNPQFVRCRILALNTNTPPTRMDRLRCYLFVVLPWLVLYECVLVLGVPRIAVETYLPFEMRLPVIEWTEGFYASTYVLVLLTPFAAKSSRTLRRFCTSGWVATAIVFPIYLTLPFIASPRPFVPHTVLGRLLLWERGLNSAAAAFPSFHMIWALFVVCVLEDRWKSLRWLWRAWAGGIAMSCVTTGMHSIADVLAGALIGLLLLRPGKLWRVLQGQTERIANSWREWRFGKLRVINHGVYAGLGAFAILAIAGILSGPGNEFALLIAGMFGLVASALWAQIIEGSPPLLRPYGFYGGLLGVSVGVVLTSFHRGNIWLLLGALCVGGPWVQAIGRLRCLVQGCCHGRLAPASMGIHYQRRQSRVYGLEELRGKPVYPTPLYSILWNAYIALVMWRLWKLHFPLHFVGGIYLVMNGLGRFVEEAYRGEPQTPAFAGLRLYQWIALLTILIGASVTALGRSEPAPAPVFQWQALPVALVFGIVCWFALGVDFPDSNRRFARLTGE